MTLPATTLETEVPVADLIREIHAFCFKLDQLLAKAEKVLPMLLASMPPEMARDIMGG